MKGKRAFIWAGLLAVLLISIPYLMAFLGGNEQWEFGGFLLNPIDGHSYLAKMQQGYQGSWKFVLPYSAEQGEGAFLFLLYIGLGHLARIFNLPLLLVFHAARVLGAIFLIIMLGKFARTLFPDTKDSLFLFIITIFGSGLGWLAVAGGLLTGDFWVSEAYPFLAMYANPHFPIGLGLMIWVILPGEHGFFGYFAAGLIIALVQPFAIVIVILISFIKFILDKINSNVLALEKIRSSDPFLKLIGIGLGGGAILVYQYIAILNDPVLSIWNQQNLTPPPSIIDFIISFSPVLLFAGFGIKESKKSEVGSTILIWAVVSIGLLLIPWNLQRRFLTGLYIPLAGMAVLGVKEIASMTKTKIFMISVLVVILVVPTNIIVLISGIQASQRHDTNIYYLTDLSETLAWITNESDENDLILSDKTTGLVIPSLTGRRVIYGHPFETVYAQDEIDYISKFFGEKMDKATLGNYLHNRSIDYILINKDLEFVNSKSLSLNDYAIVFENSKFIIYQSN